MKVCMECFYIKKLFQNINFQQDVMVNAGSKVGGIYGFRTSDAVWEYIPG